MPEKSKMRIAVILLAFPGLAQLFVIMRIAAFHLRKM
jgi:hypothetical protein